MLKANTYTQKLIVIKLTISDGIETYKNTVEIRAMEENTSVVNYDMSYPFLLKYIKPLKPKYKPVNKTCRDCSGKGYKLVNQGEKGYYTFYNKIRCACTLVETDEYKNSRRIDEGLFEDNNSQY